MNNLAGKQPEKVKELDTRLRSICNPEAENARAEAFIQRQLTAMGSKA
ncbi:MAG: hypothetical protein HYZ00_14465 [Candidatus Hydrogenedentes bacterium]|nr:hypothetical protein [Candidatus Hydrogenedentota bacterium]